MIKKVIIVIAVVLILQALLSAETSVQLTEPKKEYWGRTSVLLGYFTNNPRSCTTCHQMHPAYESWFHSSHRDVAVCNDCHAPQGYVSKYASKAYSGLRHMTTIVFHQVSEPVKIRSSQKKLLQDNCIRCHISTVTDILRGGDPRCIDCHLNSRHG